MLLLTVCPFSPLSPTALDFSNLFQWSRNKAFHMRPITHSCVPSFLLSKKLTTVKDMKHSNICCNMTIISCPDQCVCAQTPVATELSELQLLQSPGGCLLLFHTLWPKFNNSLLHLGTAVHVWLYQEASFLPDIGIFIVVSAVLSIEAQTFHPSVFLCLSVVRSRQRPALRLGEPETFAKKIKNK